MNSDDSDLRDRVTLLEENAAYQSLTIEELSAELAAQWKIIDHMQARLERLNAQFLSLQDATLEAPAITKPPHY